MLKDNLTTLAFMCKAFDPIWFYISIAQLKTFALRANVVNLPQRYPRDDKQYIADNSYLLCPSRRIYPRVFSYCFQYFPMIFLGQLVPIQLSMVMQTTLALRQTYLCLLYHLLSRKLSKKIFKKLSAWSKENCMVPML